MSAREIVEATVALILFLCGLGVLSFIPLLV